MRGQITGAATAVLLATLAPAGAQSPPMAPLCRRQHWRRLWQLDGHNQRQ
jgi:hypothetical protein